MDKLLEVKNLQTHFFTSGGVVKAVDGISYDVAPGETVAVVGESGCGKSVGAMSILRLIPNPPGRIVNGEILFQGRDLLKLSDAEMRDIRGRDIGMIFQEPMTSLNPVKRIGAQLTESMRYHLKVSKGEAEERAVYYGRLAGAIDLSRPQHAYSTVEFTLAELPFPDLRVEEVGPAKWMEYIIVFLPGEKVSREGDEEVDGKEKAQNTNQLGKALIIEPQSQR